MSGQQMRRAEMVAALSLATDLGMGQPMEHALRTCLLATRIAGELGLDGAQLSNVYYLALLRFVGCTSDANEQAVQAGRDIYNKIGVSARASAALFAMEHDLIPR